MAAHLEPISNNNPLVPVPFGRRYSFLTKALSLTAEALERKQGGSGRKLKASDVKEMASATTAEASVNTVQGSARTQRAVFC
ncbi:MAG: hypothetical protein ICV79_28835 [Flavisolibacter sp.]|nr:hypothetical protein [Flavisolibacter sp.]